MPLSDNRQVEMVGSTGDLCGECPLWLPREQALLWTDITGRRAHRFQPETQRSERLQEGFEISGLVPHMDGGFITVNSSGVHYWDGLSGFTSIRLQTAEILQLNDCVADGRGRLLTGSAFFVPGESYPMGKLLQINLDGEVRVLFEGLHLSNGLAFSPLGDVLYVTDSVARRVYAARYDAATGQAGDWRVLVQVGASEGMPDGLTVDAAGTLWSAQWYGGCVVNYDVNGHELRRIPVPAQQVSSVAFGGADLCDLYITTAAQPEPGPVPEGYIAQPRGGGDLYRVRLHAPGVLERVARIPLA